MALTVLTLDIPFGQALSDALQISYNLRIVRIGMPDGWDPAAPLTFQVSPGGTDFQDLHHVAQTHEGAWMPYEVSIPQVVPNNILLLPPDTGVSLGWIRFRSGTRSQPVAQQGRRSFAVVFE